MITTSNESKPYLQVAAVMIVMLVISTVAIADDKVPAAQAVTKPAIKPVTKTGPTKTDANTKQPSARKTITVPNADPIGYWLAPKAFRAATAKVLPSVVTIETYGGVVIPGGPKPKGSGRKRGGGGGGISRPGEGPTTGFSVSEDGYIITSTFNFLRKPAIITVVLQDGSQHVAKLLGRDETKKVCLLKIELPAGKKLSVPKYVDPDKLKIGQWAISVGVGYGTDEPAISSGIISAKKRIFGKAIQTDANISPANYGGPLINLDGDVIGICVPLSPRGNSAAAGVEWYDSGIGFAVPMHGMARMIQQMKEGKTIYPGRVGVQPKPGGKAGAGIAIASVVKDSPADKAGIKKGDVVTHVNTEKIQDMLHLRTVLGRYVAGDTIKLTLKRAGKEMKLDVTLNTGKADIDNPSVPPPPPPAAAKKPATPSSKR
jgi:serine protease Do